MYEESINISVSRTYLRINLISCVRSFGIILGIYIIAKKFIDKDYFVPVALFGLICITDVMKKLYKYPPIWIHYDNNIE